MSKISPLLYDEFFDTYYNLTSSVLDDDCYPEKTSEYDRKYESSKHEQWYQLELPLENTQEIMDRFKQTLYDISNRYELLYEAAIKWKSLEREINSNPDLKKIFDNLQLMRKLSGSKYVW